MSGQFLHITIIKSIGLPPADVERAFDLAIDWFKYGANNWIVWTTSDVIKWYGRLKPLIGDMDRLLIVKIDAEMKQGWMTKEFWDWFTRPNPAGKKPDKPGTKTKSALDSLLEGKKIGPPAPRQKSAIELLADMYRNRGVCPYCGGAGRANMPALGPNSGFVCTVCGRAFSSL